MNEINLDAIADAYYADRDPTLRKEDREAFDTCTVCGDHCNADQLIRMPTGDRICHGCFQDAYYGACAEYQKVTKTLGSLEKAVLIKMLMVASGDVIASIWGDEIECQR